MSTKQNKLASFIAITYQDKTIFYTYYCKPYIEENRSVWWYTTDSSDLIYGGRYGFDIRTMGHILGIDTSNCKEILRKSIELGLVDFPPLLRK